jgi:hypothetical protein
MQRYRIDIFDHETGAWREVERPHTLPAAKTRAMTLATFDLEKVRIIDTFTGEILEVPGGFASW